MSRKVFNEWVPRGRRRVGVVAALVAGLMAFAVASAFGVLSGSPSQFESGDGNMIVNTTGNHDWANVNFVHLTDAASSQSDDSFVSGQKQDTVCPDTYGHGNPPKDDFTDIASFSETNTSLGSLFYLHTYLYGATIRYTANGNASENVELKQGENGTCSNGLLARTAGDKLVAIDYLNGGTNVAFHVLTWVESGACFVGNDSPPCWGASVQTLSANAAEGLVNQSPITAANNPISGTSLVAGKFAEFGIDLTAAGIIPAGECKAFPQTIWESRSSGSSFVSTTKDVSIENHVISNCGQIKIIKQTDPRGIDKKFSFTSNLPANADAGGVACTAGGDAGVDASGNFCLNDAGNAGKTLGSTSDADNSTGNTVSETNLPPTTYTVSEGSVPNGFSFESLTCTGGSTSTNGQTATITLSPNDSVVCVFVNKEQLGAIKISKTSSKAAAGALSGAHFQVCTNAGPYTDANPCTPAQSGSDDVVTGADGTVCLDNLGFGDYYVKETSPPSGYAVDDTTVHTVTVNNNATCDDNPYGGEAIAFTDTPLTDLTVHVASEVAGGTQSRITCVDSTQADIGDSPKPSASTFADPVDVTANGLKPGTYTCTVIIDP